MLPFLCVLLALDVLTNSCKNYLQQYKNFYLYFEIIFKNKIKIAIVLFTSHVPVFFGLAGIILEIMSLNFVFYHNLHTANEPPNLKNLA